VEAERFVRVFGVGLDERSATPPMRMAMETQMSEKTQVLYL
jgi:hypothetical protein